MLIKKIACSRINTEAYRDKAESNQGNSSIQVSTSTSVSKPRAEVFVSFYAEDGNPKGLMCDFYILKGRRCTLEEKPCIFSKWKSF